MWGWETNPTFSSTNTWSSSARTRTPGRFSCMSKGCGKAENFCSRLTRPPSTSPSSCSKAGGPPPANDRPDPTPAPWPAFPKWPGGPFARAGIIVIENSDELFPAAEALSSLPPHQETKPWPFWPNGGGHATIAADTLTDLGVEIPQLSEKAQENLRQILPAAASRPNPVDVAGGTDDDPSIFCRLAPGPF